MTVLDRLDVLIRELEQELRLLDAKIESWRKMPLQNDQQRETVADVICSWTLMKEAPADVLELLRELRAKCAAQGMKNTEPAPACSESVQDLSPRSSAGQSE